MKAINQTEIIIALGSNTQASKHIEQAQQQLQVLFPDIVFSRNMITKAIGNQYENDFVNCIALTHCAMQANVVEAALKTIEHACGDSKTRRERGEVLLDADLLLCQGQKYHTSDWERDYIQLLLNEIGYSPF